MALRQRLRELVNPLLGRFAGVRLVNQSWGPQGFAASFRKLRAQGFSPSHILDVGAAVGTWTEECAVVFPRAHYWMIDPLEENRAALARTSAKLNARYSIAALGASGGQLVLHVHGDQSSFLASEYDREGHPRTLPVMTLDDLMQRDGIPEPDLIKVDVQGYELEVLRGAQRALATAEVILLEVSFRRAYEGGPLAQQVFRSMEDWGFRIYDICSYAQRPRDNELFQSDVVFVRQGSSIFGFEGYA